MKKVGILITSRNNYEILEHWFSNIVKCNNADKFEIMNIDEDSSIEQKDAGRKLCKKLNIVFIEDCPKGMLNNVKYACQYFSNSKCNTVLWFQHDSWPLQSNFLESFNNLSETGILPQFGVVGFNGVAQNILEKSNYNRCIDDLNKGKKPCCVLARSAIQSGDNWYCGFKTRRIKKAIPHDEYKKPFSAESVAWFSAAVDISQYLSNIDVSHPFYFHKSWDDIAYQFLVKNIHNVVLPSYYVDHRPDQKEKFGLPERSVRFAYKGIDKFHSLIGFSEEYWEKQWGFKYDDRSTFKTCSDRYKNTLLDKFYGLDFYKKPLKIFTDKELEYA